MVVKFECGLRITKVACSAGQKVQTAASCTTTRQRCVLKEIVPVRAMLCTRPSASALQGSSPT
eukprot:1798407-Pleurochrysis_carterae.AAC.1